MRRFAMSCGSIEQKPRSRSIGSVIRSCRHRRRSVRRRPNRSRRCVPGSNGRSMPFESPSTSACAPCRTTTRRSSIRCGRRWTRSCRARSSQRLGESFRQVSERLEQVYKGLGEMQVLATGVGDLRRVLANVKTRGTWGEVQLAALLEQVLAPDQYACNVATSDVGGERVEFAIRLPGRDHDSADVAADRLEVPAGGLPGVARGVGSMLMRRPSRKLVGDSRHASRDRRGTSLDKYLNPPNTTDFAIMFLPNEGLYAEVLRRPGLADCLQRDHRIVIAGPTTLWGILTSFQMGFRTLAIERRSSEVWALLGAVKTEFARFATVLDGIQKNLHRAASKIDEARKGTRTIQRKLSDVQELPSTEASALLDGLVINVEEGELLPG